MRYDRVKEGVFLERPNRFVALVEVAGKVEVCHVKNTGRCKELLVPGARVFLAESQNPQRKTKFDLVSVFKGDVLFNIDSQAPNKVFGEWLESSGYFENVTFVKPECFFKKSRFDFYFEYSGRKAFAEIKGVTLEHDGIFLFPDAPTERGVRHIEELMLAVEEGFDAFAVFVLKAKGTKVFSPNRENHPEFAEALKVANEKGVHIIALWCEVTENSLEIKDFVPVEL